jgi:hypothetical protein
MSGRTAVPGLKEISTAVSSQSERNEGRENVKEGQGRRWGRRGSKGSALLGQEEEESRRVKCADARTGLLESVRGRQHRVVFVVSPFSSPFEQPHLTRKRLSRSL